MHLFLADFLDLLLATRPAAKAHEESAPVATETAPPKKREPPPPRLPGGR